MPRERARDERQGTLDKFAVLGAMDSAGLR